MAFTRSRKIFLHFLYPIQKLRIHGNWSGTRFPVCWKNGLKSTRRSGFTTRAYRTRSDTLWAKCTGSNGYTRICWSVLYNDFRYVGFLLVGPYERWGSGFDNLLGSEQNFPFKGLLRPSIIMFCTCYWSFWVLTWYILVFLMLCVLSDVVRWHWIRLDGRIGLD